MPTGEFCREVQALIPGATLDFEPDFRQKIAEQWPRSLAEPSSASDWDWTYEVSTAELAVKILEGIAPEYKLHLDKSSSEQSSSEAEEPIIKRHMTYAK